MIPCLGFLLFFQPSCPASKGAAAAVGGFSSSSFLPFWWWAMPYAERMSYDRSCPGLVLFMVLVLPLAELQMGEACALERRDMA